MKKQSGSVHIALVVILVVALVGSLGFIFWQNFINKAPVSSQSDTTNTKTSDATPEATVPKTDVEQVSKTGTIKGTAIYPSDGYPQDFKVCALNNSTKAEIVCDNSMAGKLGKQSYEMSVTEGDYLIMAKTGSMIGYYDGYMQDQNYYKSGIDLCLDKYHAPLTVTVTAGSTAADIDAGDFYYMPENCK